MPFELCWTLSFAAPAMLALLMPGVRSLTLYAVVCAAAIAVGLADFERRITEANDGPGSVLVVLLFYTAFLGLAVGAAFRLLILAIRAHRARDRDRATHRTSANLRRSARGKGQAWE